jgi:hypothetical protein
MSEQDKRVVYMGNFERFKKEMQVKNDDFMKKSKKLTERVAIALAMGTVAIITAIAALAI